MKSRSMLPVFCAALLQVVVQGAEETTTSYRELRKLHVVGMQLPRGVNKIRREHGELFDKATAFIRQHANDPDKRGEVAVALYMRGFVLMRYGLLERGRADFQASLNLLQDVDAENKPLGLPSENLLKTYIAVTHMEDGIEPFLEALEAGDGLEPGEAPDFLTNTLYSICTELEERGNLEQAIRVYKAIDKLNAWDPQINRDPGKMINALTYRMENLKQQDDPE